MAEQSTGRSALACAHRPQIVMDRGKRAPLGRSACALATLFAVAELSCASNALAEPELNLSWSVPAACPDAEWARRRIAAQLAREPVAEVAQGVRASVAVEPSASGFALQLRTVVAGTSGERTIHAADCEELAQAAALIIALSVSEASERGAAPNPPEPPSPPARTSTQAQEVAQRAARRTLLALRADVLLDFGFFDQLGFGPSLAIAYQYGVWRAELAALWMTPQVVHADEQNAGSVEASLWALRAGGCALFGRLRIQGGPCVGGEFGQAAGRGTGDLQSPSEHREPWIAGFLGGRLSVGLIAKLALVLETDLSVLVAGPSFATKPADGGSENLTIHAPAPAQLRANAGVELRF
jgi:hypothetical protein